MKLSKIIDRVNRLPVRPDPGLDRLVNRNGQWVLVKGAR